MPPQYTRTQQKNRFVSIGVLILAFLAGTRAAHADYDEQFQFDSIVTSQTSPNYKPLIEPAAATDRLPWDSIRITRPIKARDWSNVATWGMPGKVFGTNVYRHQSIEVHFDAHVENGVVYAFRFKWTQNSEKVTMPGAFPSHDLSLDFEPEQFNPYMTGEVQPPSGRPQEDFFSIKFPNLAQKILDNLSLWIENSPEGLPLPVDEGDGRMLPRPMLFVHGIASNAGTWGVKWADQPCLNPVAGQVRESAWWEDSYEQRTVTTANGSFLRKFYRYRPMGRIDFDVICSDGRTLHDSLLHFPDWSEYETTYGSEDSRLRNALETNPIRPAFRKDASGTYVLHWEEPIGRSYATGVVSQASTSSATSAGGADAEAMTLGGAVPYPPSSDPDAPYIRNGLLVQRRTHDLGRISDHIAATTYLRQHPQALRKVLVSEYAHGSAPDLISRIERLDRTYDHMNAEAGINANGLYFYTALSDDGADTLSETHPPMWDPAAYGFTANRGQARQLYDRLLEVLDKHYGGRAAWESDPEKQIDIVCHSQGCLITREMARMVRDPSPSNPVNHLRKVVSLNSPAFGSALATEAVDQSPDFDVITDLRESFVNELELVPMHEADLDAEMRAKIAAGTVAVAGKFAYDYCSDYDVWGLREFTGVICAAGGAIASIPLGGAAAITDYSWGLKGPLLGKYELNVRIKNVPYPFTFHFDPAAALREYEQTFEDTTRHLSRASAWIDSLKLAGYPTRPLDGAPIPFSVRYSPGTGRIIDDLGRQWEAAKVECANDDDILALTCKDALDLVKSLGGDALEDQEWKLNRWLHRFQANWAEHGDLVVETESQQMVNPLYGFDPKLPRLTGIFDTLGYHLQTRYAAGNKKFVAHMPLGPVDASLKLGSAQMRFAFFRRGATQMGLDLQAALDGSVEAIEKGVQPLPKRSTPVELPELVQRALPGGSTVAGRIASGSPMGRLQEIRVRGDFDVTIASGDSLLQGIAVRTTPDAPLALAAFWDRFQGVFLWAPSGSPAKSALANGSRPVRLRLQRAGNVFTATATGLVDGRSDVASLTLALPEEIRLGALSTAEVAQDDDRRPLLAGTLQALDAQAVEDEIRPWDLKVLVRERSTNLNESQPGVLLVNHDTRALHGLRLVYEFTADSARNPQLDSRPASGTVRFENLGGDRWRVALDDPQAVLAPGGVYPWTLALHHADWSPWVHVDDWSLTGSRGYATPTEKIVVQDAQGNVLYGQPSPVDRALPRAAVALSRDDGAHEGNIVKPVLLVRNTGRAPLSRFTATWHLALKSGQVPVLETWDLRGEAKATLRDLGSGRYAVDVLFDRFVLYPGQSTGEIKIGIHAADWSPWDKTLDPSATSTPALLSLNPGLIVRDENGLVIWGNAPWIPAMASPPVEPPADPTPAPVAVEWRDESPWDLAVVRPRLRLVNQGSLPIASFRVRFAVVPPAGKTPVVETWYPSDRCRGELQPGAGESQVEVTCRDVAWLPGMTWPDAAGMVLGLHTTDYSRWERSGMLSELTGQFQQTGRVTVEVVP